MSRLPPRLLLLLLVVLLPTSSAAPVPRGKEARRAGIVVLDNCDPAYQGKVRYEDNLSYLDAAGKITFRVSGLNGCESIGSNHLLAVDGKRDWIWALEIVGHRIRKYDRKGKELLTINEVKASALAVDPDTGNLWVLTSEGRIGGDKTVVFDARGKEIARHDFSGWDIVYDPKGKAFWIVSGTLTKVDAKTAKVAFTKTISTWCASCLAADPVTGKVWVTPRRHSQVAGSKNQLLGFDNDGTLKHTIELGNESTPFHVSVGPRGAVWVTLFGKSVRRYSSEGKREAELEHKALTAAADPTSTDLWVVTQEEVLRTNAAGKVLKRTAHRGKTTQAWIVAF